MVSVGITLQVPDVLLATELLVVVDVTLLDSIELELVLLLEDEPPPQLIRLPAPNRLNIPSVPRVRRRSLSTSSFSVVDDVILLDSLDIVFSLCGGCRAMTSA